MEEEIIEDVDEIDTLIAELEISKGKGNLILCVVNSPLYRDRIIQTLKGRFALKVIDVKNGEEIISILKRKNFNNAEILIWVMPEKPIEDILNTLNNFRELFYEGKIPNIVFYNQAFSESVIRKAPDFWRYRGNYYEFKEAERGLTFEALEALTTPLSYKNKDELLRRKRINEYLLEKVRDKKEKREILSELGLIFYYLGELDRALENHEKALKLNEELGDKEGIAAELVNIGVIYSIKGDFDEALEYYKKALKLNEELKNKELEASLLVNIGNIYLDKGEFDKALEYYNKALKLDEEVEDKEGTSKLFINIGVVYRNKGELDKALDYYMRALKLNEELGRKEGIANNLINIGDVYGIKGELDDALEYFEKALKIDEELGRKEGIAAELGNIGNIYSIKGEPDKALEYYEKALDIFKEVGSRIETARVLMNMGDIFVLKKDKKRAMDCYLEALGLAKGSYIFEDLNKKLQRLKKKVIAKDVRKSIRVRVI